MDHASMLKRYRQQISKLKKELKDNESKVTLFLKAVCDAHLKSTSFHRARPGKSFKIRNKRQRRIKRS